MRFVPAGATGQPTRSLALPTAPDSAAGADGVEDQLAVRHWFESAGVTKVRGWIASHDAAAPSGSCCGQLCRVEPTQASSVPGLTRLPLTPPTRTSKCR